MFPYLNIFGVKLASYGVIALLGIVIAGFVVTLLILRDKKLQSRRPLSCETALMATPFAMIGFLVGSHFLYALTNIEEFIYLFKHYDLIMHGMTFAERVKEWLSFLGTNAGGMVFYGGLFGALWGAIIYLRHERTKPDWRAYLDVAAPGIPLFHAFGRVGCFASGCCYGIKCEHFGFTYTDAVIGSANGVRRFPVQLLESAGDLVIFAVLLILYLRLREKWDSGAFIRLYFLLYALLRFSDEFLRGDKYRGIWLGLSTSQWISLAVLIGVAVSFIVSAVKKKSPEPTAQSVEEQ